MEQILQGTKIGEHNNQFGNGVQYVKDALSLGFPLPVFKSVNNPGHVVEVKKLSPKTFTILRLYRDESLDGIDLDTHGNLDDIATARINEILKNTSLEERKYIDVYECQNENHPKTELGWRRLGELNKLFILRLAENNMRAAILGLNAGTPEYWQMKYVFDTGVFELANQHDAIVTLHEGALPMENVPPDADAFWGVNGTIPGSPFVAGGGLLTFRYKFWLYLAKERGIQFPPIVLSEFYPFVQKPLNSIALERVIDVYKRLDNVMRLDPELLGILPFTIGGPGWESEQHGFAYPKLLEYMQTIKDRANIAREGQKTTAVVRMTLRNLRKGPSTNDEILASVAGGQTVELLEKQGVWRKVRYNVEGWMHESGLVL